MTTWYRNISLWVHVALTGVLLGLWITLALPGRIPVGRLRRFRSVLPRPGSVT